LVGVGVGAVLVAEVVVELEVEVEVEVEVVVDVPVPELLVPELVVVVVVVVEVEPGAEETHDSLSDTTTPVIGSFMSEIGVPGGTFTLNVRTWPLRSVTLTVQASAAAFGIADRAMLSTVATISARTDRTFRLFSNDARLLRIHSARSMGCPAT
jgi:hypothetical protein